MSNEFRTTIKVRMDKIHTGKILLIDTGMKNLPEIHLDDEHDDVNEMLGPDPSRLLTAAIVGCLSASYMFCMDKKNLKFDDYSAEAEYVGYKTEQGVWRVKEINVKLLPRSNDEKVAKRIKQCSKIFERLCTVTESVREGIKVNVDIDI